MKRKISPYAFNVLSKELYYLEEIGELAPNQAEKLLQQYVVVNQYGHVPKERKPLNFIQIISIIGSVLIGLGVLSFVASNWSAMTDMEKFALLLMTLVISYFAAWLMELKKPNTSKALYYIGAFIYGAEIFYIGQMFHLGGELGTALMAWAAGILPLAYYRKDRVLYGAAYGLFYLSIELSFMLQNDGMPSFWMAAILPALFLVNRYLPVFKGYLLVVNFFLLFQFIEMRWMFGPEKLWYWMIPIILGLFVLQKFVFPRKTYLLVANFILVYQFAEMTLFLRGVDQVYFALGFGVLTALLTFVGHKWLNKSIPLFIANVILGVQFLMLMLYHLDVDTLAIYFLVVFVIGIIFTHFGLDEYKYIMKWIGYVFQLGAGILLTIPFAYEKIVFATVMPLWAFVGLAYIIYGMFMVYKNKLFGVLIVSVLIFRFYVDLSLVFMNKSIAFLIGGVLLLGLGFWFEKTRRGDGKNDTKTKTK
jgi:uncharacterized membrane protein